MQQYGMASGTPAGANAVRLRDIHGGEIIISGSLANAPETGDGEVIIYANAGQR